MARVVRGRAKLSGGAGRKVAWGPRSETSMVNGIRETLDKSLYISGCLFHHLTIGQQLCVRGHCKTKGRREVQGPGKK